MKPNRFVMAPLLLVLLAISPTPRKDIAAESEKPQGTRGVSDVSLGLSKTSVFDVVAPAATLENASEPGEEPLPRRPTSEWPPVIPHSIEDFTPITSDDNLCLECHLIEHREQGDPTPIPQSHFIDFRSSPEKSGTSLYRARWICVSCHVSQTRAEPLVENSAHPVVKASGERSQE
jgi:cytochrome c-type protein NapB